MSNFTLKAGYIEYDVMYLYCMKAKIMQNTLDMQVS